MAVLQITIGLVVICAGFFFLLKDDRCIRKLK